MRYILRFDDISPNMAWSKFIPLKNELTKLGVKSVLGVIPDCLDNSLYVEPENKDFFYYIRQCKKYGDTISQHGTHHVYCSNNPGILRINNSSEFSGLTYKEQYIKLKIGKEILQKNKCWEPHFMAPSHSFDITTVRALQSLGFESLTDGYGLYPFKVGNILLIPQMFSKPINLGFGVSTICVHINTMSPNELDELLCFVKKNQALFVNYKDVVNYSINPVLTFYSYITRYIFSKIVPVMRRFKQVHK